MDKINTNSTDFVSHIGKDENLPIIYGRGIGERDSQLQKIVNHIAEQTGRRVYTTQSNSKENGSSLGLTNEAQAYKSLIDKLDSEKVSIVGHSLFGVVLKSILQDEQTTSRINDINLVSPIGVYDEQELSPDQKNVRTRRLMGRFAVLNLSREAVDYVQNPADIEYIKAIGYIAKDLYLLSPKPLGINALLSTIGTWANTSITEELSEASDNNIPVTIYAGEKDPVFPIEEIKESTIGTNIKTVEITGGHSNLATTGGFKQIQDVAHHMAKY